MQEGSKVLTQRERLATALQLMAPDVTPQDRKDCMELLDVSAFTISNYLNGNVNNLDTATRMLEFFTNRKAEREQVITNAHSLFNKA